MAKVSTGFKTTAKSLRRMGFCIPDDIPDTQWYLLRSGASEVDSDGSLHLGYVLLPILGEITLAAPQTLSA